MSTKTETFGDLIIDDIGRAVRKNAGNNAKIALKQIKKEGSFTQFPPDKAALLLLAVSSICVLIYMLIDKIKF